MADTRPPIRICIVTNTFQPEIGAAPSRLTDMAKGLVAAGFEVLVITGMPHYPTQQIAPAYRGKWHIREGYEGMTILRNWVWASHSAGRLSRLLNMVSLALTARWFSGRAALAFAPDYVIAQMPPLAMPWLGRWIARKTHARLVLNLSDIWPSALIDLKVIPQNSLLFQQLEKSTLRLYRSAHLLMVQSQETQKHLTQRCPQTDILLYRTGANGALFLPKTNYQLQSLKLRLIYTGVFGMAHGILRLCQQLNFAELNAELHLFGDGMERKSIAQFIARQPDRGIFLHQPLQAEQVPEILPTYDAALISQTAYVRGTLPSKIYDAMFAALPILFHGAGEGAVIISQAQCGWISPPDHFGLLRENIRRMAALPATDRREMGQAGRSQAEKHFDRSDQIKQLVNRLQQQSKHLKPCSSSKSMTVRPSKPK